MLRRLRRKLGARSLSTMAQSQPSSPESPEREEVEEVVPWEEQARRHQQCYLQWLGRTSYLSFRRRLPCICNLILDGYFCKCEDGDGYCENESELMMLKANVGFAIHGPPTEEATAENKFSGYAKDKLEILERIYNQIVEHQKTDQVLMALLYISLDKDGTVIDSAVFRIPNPKYVEGGIDEYWFVDHTARLYKTWKDFLSNNKLPGSKCCFPKDGIYSGDKDGNVELCYGFTPAGSFLGKALYSIDIGATITSVGAGIGIFFPPIALPCAAACGVISVYSIVRGSVELADRGNHGQSLADREAARQWLSVVGSTLGLGSAGGMVAIRMLASEGRAVSSIVTGVVTGLNASSMAVNGAGILENIITIREQNDWSRLEIFQLTVSIVFFTHSVINFKTARSLYVETQNQILENHGANLSRKQRKLFEGIKKETLNAEPDLVIGKARIIKDLNHIADKKEFFARILKSNKEARANSEPVEKVKFGNLVSAQEAHGQVPVSVGSAAQHSTASVNQRRTQIVNSSLNFVNSHEPALFTHIKRSLNNMSSADFDRILALLRTICVQWKYGKKFMQVLHIIMDIRNCNSVPELVRIVQSIMQFGSELWEEYLSQTENADSEGEEFTKSAEARLLDEEEGMERLMENIGFIPGILHDLSKELEESVFHFPSNHRHWGPNGELDQHEYILIGQHAFGVESVESANVRHQDDTANVYFEHLGLVTVTSYVKESKVVVKKFQKSCSENPGMGKE